MVEYSAAIRAPVTSQATKVSGFFPEMVSGAQGWFRPGVSQAVGVQNRLLSKPGLAVDGLGQIVWSPAWATLRAKLAPILNPDAAPKNMAPWSSELGVAGRSTLQQAALQGRTMAPDGTNTASVIEETTLSVGHYVAVLPMSVTTGETYVFSFHAKSGVGIPCAQTFFSAATFGTTAFANFDLANGVVGTKGAGVTSGMEAVGNGWYRCWMAVQAIATAATTTPAISPSYSASALRQAGHAGVAGNTLLVWGWQFEHSAVMTSYVGTTDNAFAAKLVSAINEKSQQTIAILCRTVGVQGSADATRAIFFSNYGADSRFPGVNVGTQLYVYNSGSDATGPLAGVSLRTKIGTTTPVNLDINLADIDTSKWMLFVVTLDEAPGGAGPTTTNLYEMLSGRQGTATDPTQPRLLRNAGTYLVGDSEVGLHGGVVDVAAFFVMDGIASARVREGIHQQFLDEAARRGLILP